MAGCIVSLSRAIQFTSHRLMLHLFHHILPRYFTEPSDIYRLCVVSNDVQRIFNRLAWIESRRWCQVEGFSCFLLFFCHSPVPEVLPRPQKLRNCVRTNESWLAKGNRFSVEFSVSGDANGRCGPCGSVATLTTCLHSGVCVTWKWPGCLFNLGGFCNKPFAKFFPSVASWRNSLTA